MMFGTITVGIEDAAAADEVRTDRHRVDRSPFAPSNRCDLGAIVRIADGRSRAVDADRPHQRATKPSGRAEVVQGADESIT